MNTKHITSVSRAMGSTTIYNFLFDNNESSDQKKDSPQSSGNIYPDYTSYPPIEDIFNKSKEEDLDPENPFETDHSNTNRANRNEEKYKENESGDDLDVPGSELDDDMEDIGSEDEENNYYSLGGDNHENLDEDKGN